MSFQNFKSGESLLDNLYQRSISSTEFLPNLVRWIGDLGIVVALNRAKDVITYSKLEDSRH